MSTTRTHRLPTLKTNGTYHHYIGRVIERDSSVGGIIIEIRQVAEHLSSRRFAFAHIAGNGYELFVPDLLYIACLDNYVFEVYRQ